MYLHVLCHPTEGTVLDFHVSDEKSEDAESLGRLFIEWDVVSGDYYKVIALNNVDSNFTSNFIGSYLLFKNLPPSDLKTAYLNAVCNLLNIGMELATAHPIMRTS